MDVMEKLVELLMEFIEVDAWDNGEFIEKSIDFQKIASDLIANGVTVQEWVPVTERLPEIPNGWAENPEPVLYMMKNTKNIYAGYYGEGGAWRDKYFRQYEDSHDGVDAYDVLCWMWQHDLPKSPKGE